QGARLAVQAASEEVESDALVRIGPVDRLDLLADRRRGLELLGDLAAKGRFEAFAGLGLASREFPEASEVRVRATTRDEDLAGALDPRRHDLDGLRRHHVSQRTSSASGSRRRATDGGAAARSGST